jgi:hypothetical protein
VRRAGGPRRRLDPPAATGFDAQSTEGPVALPVEFTTEALEDIEDLSEIARELTRAAEHGRIVCGQSDPNLRELLLGAHRVLYRVEEEQIVVLSAEPHVPALH